MNKEVAAMGRGVVILSLFSEKDLNVVLMGTLRAESAHFLPPCFLASVSMEPTQ